MDEFLAELRRTHDLRAVPPSVQSFLLDYLKHERVRRFGDRWVINSHFPPFPGDAFTALLASGLGPDRRPPLYSATLALTNRCMYDCEHCYNAGRSQKDLSTESWKAIFRKLQGLGALTVCLSGGEPLLRRDVAELCHAFDERSAVVLQTTGHGLDDALARELAGSPVWAVSLSLDSPDQAEHDARRRRKGAFRTALSGIDTALRHGFYTVVVAVATRPFVEREEVHALVEFAGALGVHEVHLLEPAPAGKWVHSHDAVLSEDLRQVLIRWQKEYARRDGGATLSTFAYVESAEAFGCGAGVHHVYIDGTGELSPCNIVGVSVGNVTEEPMEVLLQRLRDSVGGACSGCLAHRVRPQLAERHRQAALSPTPGRVLFPVRVDELAPLPRPAAPGLRPAFYRALAMAADVATAAPVEESYDLVADGYDDAWLSQAGAPTLALLDRLPVAGARNALDIGCGTGFSTLELARRGAAAVTGVDLSQGMLAEARARAAARGLAERVNLARGDFLEVARAWQPGAFDLIVSTWVLGYLPMEATLREATRLLDARGVLAFLVHRDRSPRRELEIFEDLIAATPGALERSVALDFPRDEAHLRELLGTAGLEAEVLESDTLRFACDGGRGVLEHLLRSGAGTVYHRAIRESARGPLEDEFVARVEQAAGADGPIQTEHEFFLVVARHQQSSRG